MITPALSLIFVASPAPETCQEAVPLAASPIAPGARRGRSILRIELDETDVDFRVDGAPGTEHDHRRTLLLVEDVAWTDVVGQVSKGELQELVRRFDDVTGGVWFDSVGASAEEPDGTSPLDGRSVLFERDGAAFERSFLEEVEGDDSTHLERLSALPALAGFLPDEPVEPGERWTAEASALGEALQPLGLVPLDAEAHRLIGLGSYTGFTAPLVPPSAGLWFGAPRCEAFEGTVDLELAEVASEGGRRVARIEITVDVRTKAHLASWLDGYRMEHFEPAVHRVDVVTSLRGGGHLVWDVDAGGALSLELTGDLEVILDAAWRLQQRNVYELDALRKMRGSLRASLELDQEER